MATLQCTTTSWSSMIALRFLLGAFEAAFRPGVLLYLSFFYQRHEIGLRLELILSVVPVAMSHEHSASGMMIKKDKGLVIVILASPYI